MKNNKVLRWIPRILTLVIVTLLFVYPFWWMLVNSLNTNAPGLRSAPPAPAGLEV